MSKKKRNEAQEKEKMKIVLLHISNKSISVQIFVEFLNVYI